MFAAGNSGEYGFDTNWSEIASSRFTIGVAAIDHDGVQSYYSQLGSSNFISGYSGGDVANIVTTDRLGADGYSAGDYANDFSGTSSATPLVSGVVGLMLEANPNLSYRDVQYILAETAEVNDPDNQYWRYNAADYHINDAYGFGAIDAEAAVATALTWVSVGEEESIISPVDNVGTTVPDNNPTGITRTVTMPSSYENVEWVEVSFDADHFFPSDLEIVLTSPSGTEVTLSHSDGLLFDSFDSWTFSTPFFWGEEPGGEWSLTVRDLVAQDTGEWNSWQLAVYGSGDVLESAPPELVSVFAGSQESPIFNSAVNFAETIDGDRVIPLANAFPAQVAPSQLTFRFAEGQQMVDDEAILTGGIQIVRSGGDDSFGESNDTLVDYGWIGIGDDPNEVVVRFAETLPDDLYRIYLIGDPADPNLPDALADADEPLSNKRGAAFHDGVNLEPIQFDLDLGPQVTSVVQQPISRDLDLSAPAGNEIVDGDQFFVRADVSEVAFEFNMGYRPRHAGRRRDGDPGRRLDHHRRRDQRAAATGVRQGRQHRDSQPARRPRPRRVADDDGHQQQYDDLCVRRPLAVGSSGRWHRQHPHRLHARGRFSDRHRAAHHRDGRGVGARRHRAGNGRARGVLRGGKERRHVVEYLGLA